MISGMSFPVNSWDTQLTVDIQHIQETAFAKTILKNPVIKSLQIIDND